MTFRDATDYVSAGFALVAAALWLAASRVRVPPFPDVGFDSHSGVFEPVRVALSKTSRLNAYAAVFAGLSAIASAFRGFLADLHHLARWRGFYQFVRWVEQSRAWRQVMNERKFQHLFGHVIERLRVASPVEQARDAFNIGVSFHSMARSCVDQLVDQDEFEADCVSMVVNYASSCELYLKSLILRRGGKHEKLHYLDSLYRELTAPEREGILSLYKITPNALMTSLKNN